MLCICNHEEWSLDEGGGGAGLGGRKECLRLGGGWYMYFWNMNNPKLSSQFDQQTCLSVIIKAQNSVYDAQNIQFDHLLLLQ